ncbi:MAG: alpha/beta fold hydrolase [Steroidobacteraceae bacterium]
MTPQGFHSSPLRAGREPRNALVVLLHGWEGSAESLYVLSLGQSLLAAGYEVVRLNLRDHGDTHHLNRELFHSCRLPEVVGALGALQRRFAGLPAALAGFSLGGNFMLRAAAEAPRAGLEVAQVIAVSPVLDPASTLDALEDGLPLYSRYFILKWTRSLRRKQLAWPGEYDFGPLLRGRSLRRMTEELVLRHAGYPDLHTYLAGYAITGERLAALTMPATLVTALDDPIIPSQDLARLAAVPQLRVVVTRHGGHCGFVEQLGARSWIDGFVLRELQAVLAPRAERLR